MNNQIISEMLLNPRFIAVLNRCIDEEELIMQFERLSGVTRPPKRQHPLELMVDKATGFMMSSGDCFLKHLSRSSMSLYGSHGETVTMRSTGNDHLHH